MRPDVAVDLGGDAGVDVGIADAGSDATPVDATDSADAPAADASDADRVPALDAIAADVVDATPGAVCGDGVVDDGEECDDANAAELDGCFHCRLEWLPVTGGNFTCAWSALGAKCWGANESGELGTGDVRPRGLTETPKALALLPLGSTKIAAMSAGLMHACVLLVDGRVKCWGANDTGQLGLGDVASRGDDETLDLVPFVDLGGKAVALASGGRSSCAILAGGGVKCWGANDTGQLGLGDKLPRGDNETVASLATLPLGAPAQAIAVGGGHVCALLQGGTMKCWGSNNVGQLGLGDVVSRGDTQDLTALPALPITSVTGIAAGNAHTCALLQGGKVTCWGDNASGELGLGDIAARGDNEAITTLAPLDVPDLGAAATRVIAGAIRTCALMSGVAKCWGSNGPGALGLGDTASRGDDEPLSQVPLVAIDGSVSALALGGGHACAWLRGEGLKCWGVNLSGQLGYGDDANRGGTSATVPSKNAVIELR